jgi:3-hydroxyacyl-CoA dehydrogenase
VLYDAFGDRMLPAPPLVKLGETGRLGRKGGRGFYRYEGEKETGVDETIYTELADTIPATRTPLSPELIRDRTVLVMVNEAARALEDEIVSTPGNVDLAMITGTGFPPFRGGLLRYADSVGLATVLIKLEAFARELGPRFQPTPLLAALARAGKGFYA